MFNNFTETELKNERWRDIDGYDGAYQVSDLGRVRSKKYGYWRVMKPIKSSNGYLHLDLFKDGKNKTFSVHRLVAQAFIPNDDESKTFVNHIDECKQNNRIWNIEWCSAQYNSNYNDVQFRKKNSKRRKIEKLYNPELSIDDNIKLFMSNGIECSDKTVYELRKELGITRKHKFRNELQDLYDPNLSYDENLKVFKENGVECSKKVIFNLRKDLGLSRPRKKTN